LRLLYPKKYKLKIQDQKDTYVVELQLELSQGVNNPEEDRLFPALKDADKIFGRKRR